MVDVEALVISWGNSSGLFDAPFHANVPAVRPAKFFTVERTGGPGEQFRDLPHVAVQAWAESRAGASVMINEFSKVLWTDLQYVEGISRVLLNGVAHFPGPDGEPRYQVLLEIVTA